MRSFHGRRHSSLFKTCKQQFTDKQNFTRNSSSEFQASASSTGATWMPWSLVLKVPYNIQSPTIPTHKLCSCIVKQLPPSSQHAWFQKIVLYTIPIRSVTLTGFVRQIFVLLFIENSLSIRCLSTTVSHPSTPIYRAFHLNSKTNCNGHITSIIQSYVPKLQLPIPQKSHMMQQCRVMRIESLGGRPTQCHQIWEGIKVENRCTHRRSTEYQTHRTQSSNVLH